MHFVFIDDKLNAHLVWRAFILAVHLHTNCQFSLAMAINVAYAYYPQLGEYLPFIIVNLSPAVWEEARFPPSHQQQSGASHQTLHVLCLLSPSLSSCIRESLVQRECNRSEEHWYQWSERRTSRRRKRCIESSWMWEQMKRSGWLWEWRCIFIYCWFHLNLLPASSHVTVVCVVVLVVIRSLSLSLHLLFSVRARENSSPRSRREGRKEEAKAKEKRKRRKESENMLPYKQLDKWSACHVDCVLLKAFFFSLSLSLSPWTMRLTKQVQLIYGFNWTDH